jgi:hypothetical protein
MGRLPFRLGRVTPQPCAPIHQSPPKGLASHLTLTCRLMGMSLYRMSELVPHTHAAPGHAATARTCACMNSFTRITSLCLTPLGTIRLHCPARHPGRLTEKYGRPSFVHLGLPCTGFHGRAICDLPLVSRPRLGVQYPSAARRSPSCRKRFVV